MLHKFQQQCGLPSAAWQKDEDRFVMDFKSQAVDSVEVSLIEVLADQRKD